MVGERNHKSFLPQTIRGLPEAGVVLFFLVSLSLSSIIRQPIRENISWICIGLLCLHIISFHIYRAKHVKNQLIGSSSLWVGLALFSLVSISSSVFQSKAVHETRGWAIFFAAYTLFFFLFVCPRILSLRGFETIMRIMTAIVSFLSFVCLIIYATEVQNLGSLKLEFIGYSVDQFSRFCLFVNRNYSAQFVMWVPVASAYFLMNGATTKQKVFYGLCALITATHVVISFSRGAQLMLCISVVPLAWWMAQKRLKTFVSLVCLLGFSLLILILWHPFAQEKYLTEKMWQAHRWKYWVDGIQHLTESRQWFFGSGLFGYWPLGDNPHASYLSILLYYGVLGLGSFMGIIASFYFILLRGARTLKLNLQSQFCVSLVTAVLLGAFFEDYLSYPMQFTQLYLWFFCGLLLKRLGTQGRADETVNKSISV